MLYSSTILQTEIKKNTPNSQSFYEIHESKEMFKNGDKKHRAWLQFPLQFSNVLLYLNSLRWLNTVAGDGTGLTSQLLSTRSLPTQLMKDCATPTGSTPPTFYEQQGGIFFVPQESEQWKSCETGPLFFRPYPRRLECLTVCRCYNKGSTFSSVISRSWVLVRPGLNPRPPARKTVANPIELTGRRLLKLYLFSRTSQVFLSAKWFHCWIQLYT